ncbi:MAG TPA: hypothetical protein VIL93_00245 [Solirubrobacterales bacterium]
MAREGRRVGVFIKLAGPGGERIAIRHDGVLLWRRRLLPITTVASVFPEQRAVVLNLDRRTLASTMAVPDAVAATPLSAEEGADFSGEWQERIARYVSPGKSEADQANADRADAASKPSAESAGLERPVMGAARQPTPEPTQSDQRSAARHLLFVSSSRGYALVELEGPPPPLGQDIEVPEHPGSFLVAKLGPSPLPNDPRICAYLEQTE